MSLIIPCIFKTIFELFDYVEDQMVKGFSYAI